jgi:hypothetical protein
VSPATSPYLGAAALLGSFPDAPPELARTSDADVYPAARVAALPLDEERKAALALWVDGRARR